MSFKKQKKEQNQHGFKKKPPQHIQNHDLKSSEEHFIDDDEDTSKWYDIFKDEVVEDCPELSKDEVERLRTEARKLLDEETMLYNNRMAKGPFKSEGNWIRTIMNKGTVSDRIAAQTVAIQDSPLHTLPLLKNLISMAKVSKKNECIAVLDTLSELFLSDLLRPDRKLREFEKCPLALLDKYCTGNRVTRKSLLIHWYYEDQLKDLYRTFVSSLQVAAQDSVERTKEKAITAMYKLLAGNPEEESVLLRNLVNKIGDPSSKVASKAIYNLIQLLQVHSNMKFVVMQETEKLLFRPNIGHRAQYYGICFLSQFLLAKEDAHLARNLILIYFSFFKACVKKGEVDSRLMSALLIGVNRAYPFAKEEMEKMLDHIDTMYRVVHNAAFNISTFTLSLLFQVADFANSVSDRFYSALYRKMLDPQLATSSQQAMFLNVAYKALQKDEELNRVKVLIKRLLQISCYLPVPLVCGILYLVSQLISKRQELLVLKMVTRNRVFAGIDENEDEEEHYVDIKTEETEESSTSGDSRVKQNEIKEKESSAENDVEEIEIKVEDCEIKKESIPTWFHFKNMEDSNTKKFNIAYNPLQRNPLFAGGKYCFYTELLKLSQHFHPTVSLFAKQIIQGERIKYPGDPLQDFALPRFLDRFVYKNPKQNVKEVCAKHIKFSRKKGYIPKGIKSLRVDSANYLNEDDSRIPVDELFMYRYLKKKRAVTEVKVKKEEEEEDDSDVSSIASDEFNELLDNMMAGKSKDLDFAEEVGKSSTSKGDKDDDEDDDDEDDEEEEDDDGEDEADYAVGNDESGGQNDSGSENDLIDEDGILDEDLDDDAEDIVFDDSGSDLDLIGGSEEEDENELKPNKKKNHTKDKLTRKKPGKDSNVFVSAEEFSEMLDNMGASKLKTTGSSALSNRDNAGEKQLRWEANRDFWMKRKGKKSGKSQNKKRKWQGPASGRRNEKSSKKFKKK